jgi:hypothetical protein
LAREPRHEARPQPPPLPSTESTTVPPRPPEPAPEDTPDAAGQACLDFPLSWRWETLILVAYCGMFFAIDGIRAKD